MKSPEKATCKTTNNGTPVFFFAYRPNNSVKSGTKNVCVFLTGGAYSAYATCMSAP